MGTIIKKAVVNRKPGFLYYVDGDGNVCEAKLQKGRTRKSTTKKSKVKK